MTDEQLKGTFAYWDDDSYPDYGYLPKMLCPISGLCTKTNFDWAFGWHVAHCENSYGVYDSKWEISPKGTIQKKMMPLEEAMQNLLLYNKIIKEGGTAKDWLKAISSK